MALTPLADVADLPSAWMADPDAGRAVEVASAAVRDAAGSAITRETSTVTVPGGRSCLLRLPGPVVEVASVTVDGSPVSGDSYTALTEGLWRSCGWGDGGPVPVEVTYTHGLPAPPADIVDMVVQLAVGWLLHQSTGGGSTAGLSYSAIDDAREGYSEELQGQVSPVFIPRVTRDWLAARFGAGVSVVELL